MKTYILYAGLALTILTTTCNEIQPDDHPQSGINTSNELDEKAIKGYADSIDRLLPELEIQASLVYTLGDYSFYSEKYILNAKPVLYIEYGSSNEQGKTEQRYYIKNGQPVLYLSSSKQAATGNGLSAERAFFRNDIMFFAEAKQASTAEELQNTSYSTSESVTVNPDEQLKKLENSIMQRGDFDLVFEGITEYPGAKYLIMSRSGINAYRAPVLVKREDDFIREVMANPVKYRGRKIQINWRKTGANQIEYISGSLR